MSIIGQAATNRNLDVAGPSVFGNINYFMISKHFCNLTSRFGFHFSTVEALVARSESAGIAGRSTGPRSMASGTGAPGSRTAGGGARPTTSTARTCRSPSRVACCGSGRSPGRCAAWSCGSATG